MELSKTMEARLEKTQEALANKIMNMRLKDLIYEGWVKDDMNCSMRYKITFDRKGNTKTIKAELGSTSKKKYASDGWALNGQVFKVSMNKEDLLKAIQGTTPAAIEIIEEMKKIIQSRIGKDQ